MMDSSITQNGALSAGYTITVAFSIIGVLFIALATLVSNYFISALKSIKEEIKNIHVRIDKRAEENEDDREKIGDLTTRVVLMERSQKEDIAKTAQATAEAMLMKIRAITHP